MNNVDRLVHLRAKLFLFAAFAYGLWQFSWICQDILKESGGLFLQIAGWSTVVGSLLWVVACYFYWGYSQKVKRSKACEALNDELSKRNRTNAFLYGYLIVFCLIWLLIPATDIWNFEVKFAVRVIATIAIIFPMTYFAVLELKNDEGAE